MGLTNWQTRWTNQPTGNGQPVITDGNPYCDGISEKSILTYPKSVHGSVDGRSSISWLWVSMDLIVHFVPTFPKFRAISQWSMDGEVRVGPSYYSFLVHVRFGPLIHFFHGSHLVCEFIFFFADQVFVPWIPGQIQMFFTSSWITHKMSHNWA